VGSVRFVVKAQFHSTEAVIGPLVGALAAEAAFVSEEVADNSPDGAHGSHAAVVWAIYSQLKNDRVVLSLITIPLASISGLA
jgi:hypothetical protein